MRAKHIPVSINHDSPLPLSLQIVAGFREAILKRNLEPGSAIPGIRTLSEHFQVSITTILTALESLKKQGWIEARERSGYFVNSHPPAEVQEALADGTYPAPKSLQFDLPTRTDLASSQVAKATKLSAGFPDYRLMPSRELGLAFKQGLRHQVERKLETGDPMGYPKLRTAIQRYLLEHRGIATGIENVLVTRGNRMALNLLVQGMLQPGDVVAMEDPGSPVVRDCFRRAKLHLLAVPVDEDGLDTAALDALARNKRIRLLYLTPRFQMPTTAALRMDRRAHLLALAQEHGFLILEDDSEAEYTYDASPTLALASSKDAKSHLYLSSFSRLMAPGVRLGFLLGPAELLRHLAQLTQNLELQGDHALEFAFAMLLREGEIQRHAQRARHIYLERRQLAEAFIGEMFGSILEPVASPGGLALWIRTDPALALDLWCQRCAAQGLSLRIGRDYSLEGRNLNAIRLGFAAFQPDELADILMRIRVECPLDGGFTLS